MTSSVTQGFQVANHGLTQESSPFQAFNAVMKTAEKLFSESEMKNKVELQGHLEKALSLINEVKIPLTSDQISKKATLFHLLGRCVYGGDMETSRQYQLESLRLQLTNLNLDTSSSKLEDFPKDLSDEVLLSKCTNSQVAYDLASTLRWLGHTYQNIDRFSRGTHENIERFKVIYGNAEKLLNQILTSVVDPEILIKANWEMAQLLYNTVQLMHNFKNPRDIEGSLNSLDRVLPYLHKEGKSVRSAELQAQLFNKQSMGTGALAAKASDVTEKAILLKEQFKLISKAVEAAEGVAGFDAFLKHMFLNNKAAMALTCHDFGIGVEVASMLEIGSWIKTVTSYAAANDFDHFYHSIFYLTASRWARGMDSRLDALGFVSVAEEINNKYPNSSASFKIDAAKARALAEQMTP